MLAPVFQSILLLLAILLPELTLPFFKFKIFGFVSSGYFRTGRFVACCFGRFLRGGIVLSSFRIYNSLLLSQLLCKIAILF